MDIRTPRALIPVLVIALLLVFPLATTGFYLEFTTKVMILAIFALSLELLVGATGLVSLGHAAFYGIAAYATVLLSPKYGAASVFWLLPAAIACSALYALAVGALSLRTKGVYFIMVTLAFAQMAYYVIHDTKLGGGTDGIYLNVKPEVVFFGWKVVDLGKPVVLYYVVFGCLLLVFGFLVVLLRSRFGRALAGIKDNEQRMRAAGFPTFRYKLAAFTLAGALAGLAGFLVAVKDGFVNPEMLSWHESGAVLLMLILGGMGRLSGAVLGAFTFALLQLFFQWDAVFGDFAKHWQLLLGGTIIVSRGAHAQRADRSSRAMAGMARAQATRGGGTCVTRGAPLLRARGVTRRFGGLTAVSEVSLDLAEGEIHAVIGTNGAGKSTLINVLAGEIAISAGSVELLGDDVTAWPQPRRAQAGLGRSYQRTTIFPRFTVFENCRLTAQAMRQSPWNWWAPAVACPVSTAAASDALDRAGLAGLAERIAGLLSHGERRQLEIAMCLATRPRVLLLDEPLAGMGPEETERMLALLAGLKTGHAILLVEHDMDAVFRVSDRITVMVNGAVIASGGPAAVRADPEVQLAYLGEVDDH